MFGECESMRVSVCVQLMCYFTLIVCFGKLLPACNVLTDWRLPGPLANKSHTPLQAAGEVTFLPRLSNSPCRRNNPTFHTNQKKEKKLCQFPRAVLDFKHSIISFPHVEHNVHWNSVQDLHHGPGGAGLLYLLWPTPPHRPHPPSTPVRVGHSTATVYLGLPQWTLYHLGISSNKTRETVKKILTSSLVNTTQEIFWEQPDHY